MVQLFISQPMQGRSDEEIAAEREYAKAAAERILNEDVEVIDSFFSEWRYEAFGVSGRESEALGWR